jgi:hypothetical protein
MLHAAPTPLLHLTCGPAAPVACVVDGCSVGSSDTLAGIGTCFLLTSDLSILSLVPCRSLFGGQGVSRV